MDGTVNQMETAVQDVPGSVQEGGAGTEGAGTGEGMPVETPAGGTGEKVNALQKFINSLFGGANPEKDEGPKAEDKAPEDGAGEPGGEAPAEKTYTQADLDAAIEEAKKQWAEEQAAAGEKAEPTPEERIRDLEGQLLRKELREEASSALSADGFPTELADLVNYSDRESMKKSLETVMEAYRTSLAAGIKERLRGKTPEGLGGAASGESLLRGQIRKNIRGGN